MIDKPSKVIKFEDREFVDRKESEGRLTEMRNAFRQMLTRMGSSLTSRAGLFEYLGKSFGGARNLYRILGYPKTLEYKHFEARYSRQEIAKVIVDRPVDGSWRKKPIISDNNDPKIETEFEKAWAALQKLRKIYSYMIRLDKLAGIGQYAVILLGLSDGKQLEYEVKPGESLTLEYLQVFSEGNASVVVWEEDSSSPRFGLPVYYQLKMYQKDGGSTRSVRTHYSRVLHVVSEALESDIYGIPQMQPVYNRLQDLEMISGGSAEMYWKGARPGYALEIEDGYAFNEDDKEDLTDELQEFDHELRRFLRLKGIKVKGLEPQVSSPKDFLDGILDLIAAGKKMPKRIMMGSERGELASSQDKNTWNEQMESRREDHNEPVIIRPFIDRLIELKILPVPFEEDYDIEWPEFETPGEESIVKNALVAAQALAAYANTPGADTILPPDEFLQRFLGYTKEETDQILKRYQEILEEEIKAAEEGFGEEKEEETV